jgi:surfactin synthase thioesterase subunit
MGDIIVEVLASGQEGRPGLVCIPHAGAGVGLFSRWAPLLEPLADFAIVRLPGREELCFEKPLETMSEIVAALATELSERPHRDFFLFGHCTGGLVAYELAQELRRRGQRQPRALVVSSAPPPGTLQAPFLHDAPDEELKKYIVSFSGGDPDDIPEELWELLAPAIRADLRAAALATYCAEPLDVPLRAFHGTEDVLLSSRAAWAWARYTRSAFGVTEFAASHFLIDTCGAALARELAAIMTADPPAAGLDDAVRHVE